MTAFPITPPSLGQGFRERPVSFVIVTSDSYQNLAQVVRSVQDEMAKNPGFVSVDTDLRLNKPEIRLEVDREKAADLGVGVDAVARAVETMMGGRQVTRYKREGEHLVPMWERYRKEYGLRGAVMSLTQVGHPSKGLKDLKRYRLVLIDESHNLRNREGRRYKTIADYIRQCDAKVILLTATPYNKRKTDLSAQLRLLVEDRANIGIRPEQHMRLRGLTDAQFERVHQCPPHSILAMEKSEEFDYWRELIRLYMVCRTRSFILQHYAAQDAKGRSFLLDGQGKKRYFPTRVPLALTFPIDEADPRDRYAQLYSGHHVSRIAFRSSA